jgi:DUF1680 family protein
MHLRSKHALGAFAFSLCAAGLMFVSEGSSRRAEARPAAETLRDSPRLVDLPLSAVRIEDRFWSPRIEINRTKSLDHVYAQLEATGGIRNFEIAAGKAQGKFGGPFWADSDVYKWIEGASYSLLLHPDPKLDAKVDELIAKIAAAQQPDGYLNTFIQLTQPDLRFKNFAFFHEDFSMGHLFEAAVGHYESTGKKSLLNVAVKAADLLDSTFGPGKRDFISGHEGIELALVRLYRATGEKRYLKLAEFMVNGRGQKPSVFELQYRELPHGRQLEFLGRPLDIDEWYKRFFLHDPAKFDTRYAQDHLPVREQKEAVGHAVRAMFLYCAMADLAYETGDAGLLEASKHLHDSVTLRRMYVTGGIGPSEHNEGFTADYDLPNDNAYQETCASSGMVLWNHRLLKLTGDSKYADVMELSLYNAMAAGVSLDGNTFCYVTPLASRGDFKRSGWFGVPCCPTTVVRFVPSVGRYIYSQSTDGLWVNLYIPSQATAEIAGGKVSLRQTSDFPWEGNIRLQVIADAPREFALRLRVPGWAKNASFKVNGVRATPAVSKGYAVLKRKWASGDAVEISLPMEIERLEAHPKVIFNRGKVALRRGPLVFAFEQADQEASLDRLVLPANAPLRAHFEQALFGGTTQIWGEALEGDAEGWEHQLYRPLAPVKGKPVRVKAVPYAVWGNRGLGKMIVWVDSLP